MKNRLFNNMGLKCMAALFALILWMSANQINNPMKTEPYANIKVQLINTSILTSQGKTYKVMNSSDSIIVHVRAQSSVLDNISPENIVARADVSQMREDGTVPIELSVNTYEEMVESLRSSRSSVQLEVEDKTNRQLSIEVVKNGQLPEGYATGTVKTETNTMSISGPESVMDQVVRAVVEVALDEVTSDIDMIAQIKLLDENGREISSGELKKSIDSVKVTVPILNTKEVPVSFSVSGTPAEGYTLTGSRSVMPDRVVIAGREAALENVEAIVIPESELNVDGAQDTVIRMVDLTAYLPSGISFGDPGFDGKVMLTAEVEGIRRKTIDVDLYGIQLLEKPEGWDVEVVSGQQLKLVISGLQENLDEVTAATITPHVDVSALVDGEGNVVSGEQEAEVRFLLPGNVRQTEPVKVMLRFTKTAQAS